MNVSFFSPIDTVVRLDMKWEALTFAEAKHVTVMKSLLSILVDASIVDE